MVRYIHLDNNESVSLHKYMTSIIGFLILWAAYFLKTFLFIIDNCFTKYNIVVWFLLLFNSILHENSLGGQSALTVICINSMQAPYIP